MQDYPKGMDRGRKIMAKVEAVPVKVDRSVYDKVKHYTDCTGVPAARVISEAISDWLETTGEARLEALTKINSKVMCITDMN
jgi:hypothetical protein